MIVQCDQCSAKFRLDDSKVKEGGAKVRCSKCKHIFVVHKPTPAEENDYDSLLSGLAPSASGATGVEEEVGLPGSDEHVSAGPSFEAVVPGGSEQPAEGGATKGEGFNFDEFTFSDEPVSPPSDTHGGAEARSDFVFGERDIAEDEPGGGEMPAPERETPGFDDTAFTFEEDSPQPVPEEDIAIEGFEEAAADKTFDFGAVPPLQQEVLSTAPATEFSFDQVGEKSKGTPPEPEKEQQPDSFDVGEFSFGEAESSVQTDQKATKPEEPEEWEWEKPEPSGSIPEAIPPSFEEPLAADELPPLSISSRRKGGSALSIAAIALVVLLVIALAGGGFYVFKKGPAAFNEAGLGFMAKWFGLAAKEEGGIAIRNATALFLNNSEAGEIFVITGEAVNNYAKPRASIQVRATLFGAKGEPLLQKSAYCGNTLSKDQLMTLPLARLDSAMGNQFGDSLSNLVVHPSKGIPFVVVFANVPKGATDFGVEVVGSTVAAQ